jgi:DNA-binding CsgD family transcriptional regulator/predicted transcriptional regulator
MKSQSLSISAPGLVHVLRDIRTMQRWEILRRSQRGHTVAQLAAESRSTLAETQDALDRLKAVGLVEKQRMNARTKQIRYQAAMERLVISFDKSAEVDRALMREVEHGMRQYSRSVIDGCSSTQRPNEKGRISIHGVTSVVLTVEDACAVRDAFRGAYALLVEAERRARESADSAEKVGYHLTFEMRELDQPELPMAEIFMVEQAIFVENRNLLCNAASMVLSPRELEVARSLDLGKSRPQIARELGLSEHTIVTLSKRIYRKLGVHSRAELSTRLKAA